MRVCVPFNPTTLQHPPLCYRIPSIRKYPYFLKSETTPYPRINPESSLDAPLLFFLFQKIRSGRPFSPSYGHISNKRAETICYDITRCALIRKSIIRMLRVPISSPMRSKSQFLAQSPVRNFRIIVSPCHPLGSHRETHRLKCENPRDPKLCPGQG